MKKKSFLFIYLLCYTVFAQQEPNLSLYKDQKLKTWYEYCTTILKSEKYNNLISEADKGIVKSKDNPKYLAKFYFLKGYAYEYSDNQYQNALVCYEKSLYYTQKNNQLEDETSALMRLNYVYYSTSNFTKRQRLISYIKKVVDTTKNIKTKSILNGSIGEYYLDNSNYEQFIQYQLKAIDYKKMLPNEETNFENIGISYSQIASAYIKMKQFKKAIEYLNDAVPYLKKSNYGKSFSCNYYIESYANLKKSDSIQKYYKLLNQYATNGDTLFLNLSFGNRNIAEYYADNGQINTAYHYAKKAVQLGEKSNDEEILMEATAIMGSILYKKGDYQSAIKALHSAAKNALNYDKSFYVMINKKLSESYSALGLWQKAYQYNELYSKYNNQILQESAKQSIANAEAQYQNKTKKQEIKNLSAQNTIKNIQINEARKQLIFLIFGIILIAIIGLLLFKQSQNRKKTNQKLQVLNQELDNANKIKAQFFGILNHDLRSPVANLIHFLHLQRDSPELLDEETQKRMQTKTLLGAEDLLASMEDILLWSKGQMENFEPHPKKISVNQLFEDTKKVFSGYQNIQFEYYNPNDLTVFTDENYLKTIIRNLTSNAINAFKATLNPQIVWKAWQENGKLFLSITDNGSGASLDQFKALYDDKVVVGIKTGLGLHLIRDLAKVIDCEITVDSKMVLGTTFKLKL
jgi:signal transduction histidine kinase